jgi:hypothetical protein
MSHRGFTANEYGTRVSAHVCDQCGREFTVCPAKEVGAVGWDGCLSPECPSYDVERDVDLMLEIEPWRVRR